MQIYLPIAETSVNIFVLLGLGGLIGVISGLFGVGGGFLMTPILIFIGIPPSIAVSSGVNQIVASSFSGALAHWKKGNVDLLMGILLLVGGIVGSSVGVHLFAYLKTLGQIDLIIKASFVLILSFIGVSMLIESLKTMRNVKKLGAVSAPRGPRRHTWMQNLPLKVRFRRSGLYMSSLLPFSIGFVVGVIVVITGVSGVVMVPAMIYILGMRTKIVIGTSLFQVFFLTSYTTILQAGLNKSVDVVLAVMMIVGGVIGAQFGAKVGAHLRGEQLRILLSLLVLSVCIKLLTEMFITPAILFSLEVLS